MCTWWLCLLDSATLVAAAAAFSFSTARGTLSTSLRRGSRCDRLAALVAAAQEEWFAP